MRQNILLSFAILFSCCLCAQVQDPGKTVYTNTKSSALIFSGDMQYALGAITAQDHWGIEFRAGAAVMDELVLSGSYRYQRLNNSGFSSIGTEGRYYISKLPVRPVVKAGVNWVFGISNDEPELITFNINGQFELGAGASFIPKNSLFGIDVLYHYWMPQQFFAFFDDPLPKNHSGLVLTGFLLIN